MKCVLCGCKAHAINRSMFRVPRSQKIRESWEQALGQSLEQKSGICEVHFSKKDIIRKKVFRRKDGSILQMIDLKYPRLKEQAVPHASLDPHKDSCSSQQEPENELLDEFPSRNSRVNERTLPEKDYSQIPFINIKKEYSLEDVPEELNISNVEIFSQRAQILLPPSWSRIFLSNSKSVVFASHCLDENGFIVPTKELYITENGDIKYRCNGKELKTIFQSELETVEELQTVINNFHSASICAGADVPSPHRQRSGVKDNRGIYRHISCPMVLEEQASQCFFCVALDKLHERANKRKSLSKRNGESPVHLKRIKHPKKKQHNKLSDLEKIVKILTKENARSRGTEESN